MQCNRTQRIFLIMPVLTKALDETYGAFLFLLVNNLEISEANVEFIGSEQFFF